MCFTQQFGGQLQAARWRAHSLTLDENERCERVSAKLRELPLQTYHTREALQKMSVPELKVCSSTAPKLRHVYSTPLQSERWNGVRSPHASQARNPAVLPAIS